MEPKDNGTRLPFDFKGAPREVYNQIDSRYMNYWIDIKDALSEKLIKGESVKLCVRSSVPELKTRRICY